MRDRDARVEKERGAFLRLLGNGTFLRLLGNGALMRLSRNECVDGGADKRDSSPSRRRTPSWLSE